MYDRILVPTDGSHATERAVENAVDLAKQYGATIHALYVVDSGTYASLEAGTDIVVESLETEGKEAVEHVVQTAERAGVETTTSVESGSAYETILDYAEANDCDLIVMGTHGRSGLDRYLLGSVTEKVVRRSDVPVLTVRADEEE
ncbi:universal stress protein [Halogeometricum luteum]|uniref:Universal stress protein n=1 Tax=Halogeometricum luteum TaxID=2950537 RepID=A0ABU2FWC5_9EURY|nr:universal stress protein [Halogeometricum sp. S3BR5-2]MDS0292820.1 universal stress protein [Halogeometricum sp. S3BR5-2]